MNCAIMDYKLIICFMALFLFSNCNRQSEKLITEQDLRKTEEALIGANRIMIQKDRMKILDYIKKNNLNLIETPTGLWYGIYHKGNGVKVMGNSYVTINYKVTLLDGTICYSSDSLGPKKFVVGKDNIESGLEEGVLLLNEGSKAIFIIPPHLAHGLQGDSDKVPARSIIIYDIQVINIE